MIVAQPSRRTVVLCTQIRLVSDQDVPGGRHLRRTADHGNPIASQGRRRAPKHHKCLVQASPPVPGWVIIASFICAHHHHAEPEPGRAFHPIPIASLVASFLPQPPFLSPVKYVRHVRKISDLPATVPQPGHGYGPPVLPTRADTGRRSRRDDDVHAGLLLVSVKGRPYQPAYLFLFLVVGRPDRDCPCKTRSCIV
jgi:hypothetical protein